MGGSGPMGPAHDPGSAFNWCCYPKWQPDQNTREFILKHYLFNMRLVCALVVHAAMSLCIFWESAEERTRGWVNDSLVVEHHVRQPDVFWGQPDLQHSIKLLRDPSQTIVLPLLRANKNTVLSHSCHSHSSMKTSSVEQRGKGLSFHLSVHQPVSG